VGNCQQQTNNLLYAVIGLPVQLRSWKRAMNLIGANITTARTSQSGVQHDSHSPSRNSRLRRRAAAIFNRNNHYVKRELSND